MNSLCGLNFKTMGDYNDLTKKIDKLKYPLTLTLTSESSSQKEPQPFGM